MFAMIRSLKVTRHSQDLTLHLENYILLTYKTGEIIPSETIREYVTFLVHMTHKTHIIIVSSILI